MSKIMIMDGQGANHFYRLAWARALQTVGHTVFFWDDSGKSPFDAFAEFNPEIFIGSTWQLNRAIVKNLCSRPNVKVLLSADNWGDLPIDLQKYPVGVATDEQKRLAEELYRGSTGFRNVITQHNASWAERTHGRWKDLGLTVHGITLCADVTEYYPIGADDQYKCEIAYCGGYWPYKGASTLDRYLLPLMYPNTSWRIRLFGSGWNTVHYQGKISSIEMAKFYRNAGVTPSFGEAHSHELYADLPQRYFQVPACMGFQISPRIIGIDEIYGEGEIVLVDSTEEFFDRVIYYLNNPDETIPYRVAGCKTVFAANTGFHRAAELMRILGEDCESLINAAGEAYDRVNVLLEQI